MSWSLDTNVCIAVLDPRPSTVQERFFGAIEGQEAVFVSTIVVHELWYGVRRSARQESNAAGLDRFLGSGLVTLPFDDEDAREAAAIRADLARIGRPIGPYDMLIAAQAKRRGLTLVTANSREFARVPGLAWEDWAKPKRGR